MHFFLFFLKKISYSTFEISNYLKNTHKKYFQRKHFYEGLIWLTGYKMRQDKIKNIISYPIFDW